VKSDSPTLAKYKKFKELITSTRNASVKRKGKKSSKKAMTESSEPISTSSNKVTLIGMIGTSLVRLTKTAPKPRKSK
jgi:hypothetical protein